MSYLAKLIALGNVLRSLRARSLCVTIGLFFAISAANASPATPTSAETNASSERVSQRPPHPNDTPLRYILRGPKMSKVGASQIDQAVDFYLQSDDGSSRTVLETPKFTVMKLEGPTRVMIDVIGAQIDELTTPVEPLSGEITQIGAVQLGDPERPVARLILTLANDLEHKVSIEGKRLRFLVKIGSNTEPVAPLELLSNAKSSPERVITQSSWRVESLTVKTLREGDDLRFTRQKALLQIAPNDHGMVLPTPYVDESDLEAPHLVLPGLRVTKELEQRIDTQDLDGPIRYLSLLNDDRGEEVTAHLVAEIRQSASHQVQFVEQADGEYILEWSFVSSPQASQRLAQSMSASASSKNRAPTFKTDEIRAPRVPSTQRRKKRYLGKRIKINIKDADIHNVLRFLADCGQVNIVTSDEVEGKVTLMLNQVPWDQALDIILRSKGLDMVREGNIIRVAPREAIAAERKAELEKTQIKEQLKPIMIRLITVNHAEGEDMVGQVKGVLSERGSVSFDLRTNTLIIKDIEEHIEAAEDLVKRLDTQTPQVLIEARIVEVNKVNEKELGIQWGGSFNGIVGTGNATGLSFPSSVGLKGAADDIQFRSPGVPAQPNFMINLPATVGVGSGGALGLSLGSVDGAFNLNVRLSAAASRGTVKIVSSPKITTLDNKKALISQGVSIPISQVSAQGVQTVFFDATLSLEVTPHVTQDGNIYLQLKANNDTPDFQNVGSRGDPTILKKEASTQVLLQDGETTVIGGIYTSNAGYGTTEWPILSQVPILGALFRKTNERSQKNELLIFITPRVINRLASRVNTR